MPRAVRILVTVLVAVFLTGGQWAMLQSVAWSGMFVNYIRDLSLADALEKTFDGEDPCPMCCAVKKGREQEKQQGDQAVVEGAKFACALPLRMDRPCHAPGRGLRLCCPVLLEQGFARAPPPVPPPIC